MESYMSRTLKVAAALLFAAGMSLSTDQVTATATTAHTYKNCTDLHRAYRHGVGKVGAHDHVTSGKPVTNFTRSNALYAANKKSDRDHDGIACEAR
jgi:hypothetical protein